MAADPTQTISLTIPVDAKGERIDRLLGAHLPDLSRERIQELIKSGFLKIDDALCVKPSYRVQGTEHVVLEVPPRAPSTAEPISYPLDILFEDEDLLV